MAAFLVGKGAEDVDSRGLWNACYTGNLEVAKALVTHPKSSYSPAELETSFVVATSRSSANFLDMFLDSGVDINAKDSNSRTALIVACESESPFRAANVVSRLLDRGADILVTADTDDSNKHYSICACSFVSSCPILF
jgi:hypothetical protein